MSSNQVIDKYFLLLFEYLHVMQASSTIESLPTSNVVVVGWNAVTHIFKLSLIHLKSVDDAFQKAQKGMYCYLEYIEQISKQTVLSVEPLEAVIFVYDKVLSPISHSAEEQKTQMNAVNALNKEEIPALAKKIERLDHLANILLFENMQDFTLAERIRVMEDTFYKYANMFLLDASMKFDSLFLFMEQAKCMVESNRENWTAFLHAFYKNTKRAIKQKTVPTEPQVAEKCLALKTGEIAVGTGTEDIARFVFT
jgi:hypothetical protein